MCGGVTLVALAGAAPAQAVSFVSTFRPPGNTTEVGRIDTTTGIYSNYGTYELQLTDIAVNNSGQVFGSTYDQLYTINPGVNPAATVGNLGISGLNGLGFDSNNNLYGIAGRNPSGSGSGNPGFYKIDTTNTSTFGTATLISNLGGFAPTAFGFAGTNSTGDTSDIAFNPNTNKFFAVSGNNDSLLFSIDPSNGATATIGSIKLGGNPVGFVSGLTFDGSALRGYTTSKLQITIDPSTGTVISSAAISGINTLPDGSNFLVGGAASTITAVPEPSSAAGFAFLGVCFGARLVMKRKQQQLDK